MVFTTERSMNIPELKIRFSQCLFTIAGYSFQGSNAEVFIIYMQSKSCSRENQEYLLGKLSCIFQQYLVHHNLRKRKPTSLGIVTVAELALVRFLVERITLLTPSPKNCNRNTHKSLPNFYPFANKIPSSFWPQKYRYSPLPTRSLLLGSDRALGFNQLYLNVDFEIIPITGCPLDSARNLFYYDKTPL